MKTMHGNSTVFLSDDERTDQHELLISESPDNPVVPGLPSVMISPLMGTHIDPTIVAFPYYNSFNYSLLTGEQRDVRLTVGITSPNPGEGKTLVASNLAVSLAMAYRKRTVLVDLNVQRPRLHEVFGIAPNPGLIEALEDGAIHVSPTQIGELCVLAAGTSRNGHTDEASCSGGVAPFPRVPEKSAIGLEQLPGFLNVLYALEQEFEFVVVDMPSINTRDFPILFASRLNGLIVVIDTRKTKRHDIERMLRQVNERQVLGFVFNRVQDDAP